MKDKLTLAYEQIEQELNAAKELVIKLTERKQWLESLGSGSPTVWTSSRPDNAPQTKDGRAPRGSVEKAILGVLTAKGMTNAEVRSKLKANGYAYSLEPMPFAKALNRLAERKKIKKTLDGSSVIYCAK